MNVDKLAVARDRHRLNKELVSTLGRKGRVLLHGLEENYIGLVLKRRDAVLLSIEYEPDTSTSCPASMRPELGRTQYLSTCESGGGDNVRRVVTVLLRCRSFNLGPLVLH